MVNHDLVREVLRLKDEAVMFPREKSNKTLSIQSVVMATDRPKTHMEWWLNILNGGQPSSITKQPKIQEPEVKPHKSNLTNAHKNILKSLSYKPRKADVISFSVAA